MTESSLPRASEASRGVSCLVEHFFRREHARLLAALVRRLGAERLPLAEEAVQEALLAALRTWPVAGIPAEPGAWLHTAALALLDALGAEHALARNHLWHAARADCLLRLGRVEQAKAVYRIAADLAPTSPERRYLERRHAM